jgi:mono/diheme cytochrome c family protein
MPPEKRFSDATTMKQRNSRLRRTSSLVTMSAASLLLSFVAQAQSSGPSASGPALSTGFAFTEQSGEQLFAGICRGCHMSDGKGATGAGTYPSLAGDRNLEARGYPIDMVVNGQRAMPPFGSMMNDDQVAAVINYLRTHFDNDYQDRVTVDDVKAVRR